MYIIILVVGDGQWCQGISPTKDHIIWGELLVQVLLIQVLCGKFYATPGETHPVS